MKSTRRIITAISRTGDSQVISDEDITLDPLGGPEPSANSLAQLWATNKTPVNIDDDYQVSKFSHIQTPGSTHFVSLVIAPTQKWINELAAKGHKIADPENFRLHRTQSVDYVVVVSGQITLRVGEDKVILNAGDCVVQRGTVHAWHNHTDSDCHLVSVGMAAEPDPNLPAQYEPSE